MAYKAVLCKIKTQPIPGADNIRLGTCLGYQVFVSKDTQEGQFGVFFETDGKLSHEFCSENNYYRHIENNKDQNAKPGFIEDNGRIKSLKLKFGVSNGFWVPLSAFDYTKYNFSKHSEGWEFDTLGSHKICEKYYTPETLRQMRREQNKKGRNPIWKAVGYVKNKLFNDQRETVNFPEHYDTAFFARSYQAIPKGAKIVISSKIHGSSGRTAKAPTRRQIYKTTISSWIMSLFGKPTVFEGFDTKYGSRRVVLKGNETGYYGSNQFRYDAFDGTKLNDGEAVYGEIVGFLPTGTSIMPSHNNKKVSDKNFVKLFGEETIYSYGCEPKENKFYLYNIKKLGGPTNNHWFDLPYEEFLQRAQELGVPVCPEIEVIENYDGDADALFERVMNHVEDPKTFFSRKDKLGDHIQEGVIVRTEFEGIVTFYKLKSTLFGILEGYKKDDPTYVDMEESS